LTWRVLVLSRYLRVLICSLNWVECWNGKNSPQGGARLALANLSVEELVLGYASLAITVRPHKIAPVIKADPDDDKVLACAKTANAEIIVSGDTHLLDLNEYEGIKIMTVTQLLEQDI
jgi:predicted nucleic acid-binding protein